MEQQPGAKRPPILTKYLGTERAQVDAEIYASENEDITHHSYSQEVIFGWEEIVVRFGPQAPIFIGALGNALTEERKNNDSEAIDKFIENYIHAEDSDAIEELASNNE